ncbi:hypothetical protein Tsubulata_030903 [Turnera subulata]|uniref:CCHC-type domain-containing protein n=1 Tax=Turnera subulata TaxID=218843 RepID=A0A9Q0F746_9ROSI|nr:hypothetical protein Tsubulata_030903 [Turnera subulata]
MEKKRKEWEAIGIIEEEESDEFLLGIAEAEAQALSSPPPISTKRGKVITESAAHTQTHNHLLGFGGAKVKQEKEGEEEEGAYYLAALRGSKSTLWQQRVKPVIRVSSNSNNPTRTGLAGSGISSPEKMCPCGLGACVVYTASTEKNRGRTFYKCPLKPENGGCGFFQWCDGGDNNASTGGTITQSSYASSKSGNGCAWPEIQCPCGAGPCSVLTAKTGKNIGQQFYRCPVIQGSCGFFKWCNDNPVAATAPVCATKVYSYMDDSNTRNHALKAGSTCFKCGKEGHWARDCQTSSSVSTLTESRGRPAPSGACYKCGKLGHWAKDCTSSQVPLKF